MTDAQNKALYIKEQCMAAGMTLAGAAGVIANVEAESAFRSNNLQDCYNQSSGMSDDQYTAAVDNGSYKRFSSDRFGYGLAQWTSDDRKAEMLAFHRSQGKSIGDFNTQVAFLIREMRSKYSFSWRTCCTSNSAYECGYNVCSDYERPANTQTQAQYRGQLAKNWCDWLNEHAGDQSDIPDDPHTDPQPVTLSWPPRTIDKNCFGWPEVWLLQSILKCRGYNVLIDGIWSQSLDEAVKVFQAQNGLDPDGIVGPKTWAILLERR